MITVTHLYVVEFMLIHAKYCEFVSLYSRDNKQMYLFEIVCIDFVTDNGFSIYRSFRIFRRPLFCRTYQCKN